MALVIVDGEAVEIDCCFLAHEPGHKYHGRNVAARFAHCVEVVQAYSTHDDPVERGALAFRLAARDECLYHAEAALFGGACKGACCQAPDLVEIDQAAA